MPSIEHRGTSASIEAATTLPQSRFDLMLAASATAVICADARGAILTWNMAAEHLFGWAAADVVGKSLDIIIPGRFRAAHGNGMNQAAASGASRLSGKAVEVTGIHRDGHEITVEVALSMWREGGAMCFGALVRDIGDRVLARDHLERRARYDALTGLPNRTAFHDGTTAAIEAPDQGPVTVMLLDLDGFKDVNDTLGHAAGDTLLCVCATRIAGVAGEHFVARLGGDEFAILCAHGDPFAAEALAAEILNALVEPVVLHGQQVYVTASIGITLSSFGRGGAGELLARADLAMYAAKADGGSCCRRFTPSMERRTVARRRLSAELRDAVEQQQFELWYQPQVRLSDETVVGVEALLRWRHPRHGMLLPAAFLPVLENSTHAARVGDWIIDEACRQLAAWRDAGLPPLRIGINLFAAQFRARTLVERIDAALCDHRLSAGSIELEVTENIALDRQPGVTATLAALRERGVGIALDDFGTGYASLSILKSVPLTRLKIDRGFVRDLIASRPDQAIIGAVTAMARSLDLTVIAEGVETAAQCDMVRQFGCTEAQGYLYGRAQPPQSIALLLDSDDTWHTGGPPRRAHRTGNRSGARHDAT